MFDDTIANIETNEKLNSIVTELFVRGRKLNISLVFISQSYFKVPKTITSKTQQWISDFFVYGVSLEEVNVRRSKCAIFQNAFILKADLKSFLRYCDKLRQ